MKNLIYNFISLFLIFTGIITTVISNPLNDQFLAPLHNDHLDHSHQVSKYFVDIGNDTRDIGSALSLINSSLTGEKN